ncbi:hypothetical protein [Microbacterium sp. GXS0129]|uniref:hypothetical protein n=1 Tax=Microbacterium sp. GXS0129 TaxID=3377836 RepID=UPI00383A32FE
MDTFVAASHAEGSTPVFGEVGGRRNNLFELLDRTDVAAMPNPKGAGVLLSVVYRGDDALARSTAHRTAWLLLDGTIYPVDTDASQAFALLWDGYPDGVKAAAGLGSDYFSLASYGVRDFESWNADSQGRFTTFLNEANGLCTAPTVWGQ